jgi:MerR family transcriptional regulator, light-induced transcriptional regulator
MSTPSVSPAPPQTAAGAHRGLPLRLTYFDKSVDIRHASRVPQTPDDRIQIGELARRTGVSAPLLRAWERRYGLLRPLRTPGGFRTYGPLDEERVRAMQVRMDAGMSASLAAAALTFEARARAPDAPLASQPAAIRSALSEAFARFDERGAHRALDRLFATFSLETALVEGVLPSLQSLGVRWEAGEVSIAEEHFATAIVRGRLLALARNWGDGGDPRALLACPPAEQHDLGLICFGLGLRERGWRITLLGPNTPIDTLAEAADRLEPAIVIVAAMHAALLEGVQADLARLAHRHRVAVAGPGASETLGRATGAWWVGGPPIDAAAWVDDKIRRGQVTEALGS